MRRSVGCLVVLLAAGAIAAGFIAATSGGSGSVTTHAAGGQILGYGLTSDAHGAATLVWSTVRFVDHTGDSLIRVSQQSAGGGWSAPVQLGGLAQTLNPVLAESASGAAVIAWSSISTDPLSTTVFAVTRSSADAGWSSPVTVSSAPNVDDAVNLGIDAAGVATVTWAEYGPTDPAIWDASIDTATARATPPEKLIPSGVGSTETSLTVSGSGAALLSWQHQLSLTTHQGALPTVHAAEMAAYRTPSGHWLAPRLLLRFSYPEEPAGSEVWGPSSPSSAITADGTAAVTWFTGPMGGYGPLEVAARHPTTGGWSVQELASVGAAGPALEAGPRDSLLALWSDRNDGPVAAASADAIRWSTAQPLPASSQLSQADVAGDGAGDIAVTGTGPHNRVAFTLRSPSGSWCALRHAGTGYTPELAVSTDGAITVAWVQSGASGGALETRTYR